MGTRECEVEFLVNSFKSCKPWSRAQNCRLLTFHLYFNNRLWLQLHVTVATRATTKLNVDGRQHLSSSTRGIYRSTEFKPSMLAKSDQGHSAGGHVHSSGPSREVGQSDVALPACCWYDRGGLFVRYVWMCDMQLDIVLAANGNSGHISKDIKNNY